MVASGSNVVRKEKKHAGTNNATAEDQCHPKKIFVGGLAHKCTTQHLRDHFTRFGTILDAVVLRWPDGRSRGFGYVTFADVVSASAALREGHSVGGRQVEVKRAVPGTNKLFVGGLPQNTPASELREHFERFGVVSDAVVMIDAATNRSRGFGFVCFLPGPEGAEAVAVALANYDHHFLRNKWIEVKSASPPHKLVGKEKSSQADCVSTTATDDSSSETGETGSHVLEHTPSATHGEGFATAAEKSEKPRRAQKKSGASTSAAAPRTAPMGEPAKISLTSSSTSSASEWLSAGTASLQQPPHQQQLPAPYPFGGLGFFPNGSQAQAQAQAAHWYFSAMAASAAAAAASAGKYDVGAAMAGGYPPAPFAASGVPGLCSPPGLDATPTARPSDSHVADSATLNIDELLRQAAVMPTRCEAGRAAPGAAPQGRAQVQI